VQIVVNGETREVPENLTVATLVEHLALPSERTAVERNREVIRRADWPIVPVTDNDRIEIVHFVGGG
jgi:thiamine biosynthesis protein ThiS